MTEEEFREWFSNWVGNWVGKWVSNQPSQTILTEVAEWKGDKLFRWSKRKELLIHLAKNI